jgi:putative ABC transport system substrate-binding protein
MRWAARAVLLLALALCGEGVAQSARLHKVAYLASGVAAGHSEFILDLKRELAKRGYVEGRNLTFVQAFCDDDPERLKQAAERMALERPDVIITPASRSTIAARRATSAIPIVMFSVADPVGQGLVQSMARPGGNVTGIANVQVDIADKLVEFLLAVAPQVKSVAILTTSNPASRPMTDRLVGAARARGIASTIRTVDTIGDVDLAFETLGRSVQGWIVPGDGVTLREARHVAAKVSETKKPAIYGWAQQAEQGGLLSYGIDPENYQAEVAGFVDRILKGEKPAEIAVHQPRKFILVVNQAAARAAGVTIPQELMIRADKVLQ